VTVKLSQTDPLPVTVNYTTTDGTAQAGADYVAASGTLTFAPGVSTQQIPITIIGDTIGEFTEQFFVDLSGPVTGILGQSRATVTIGNDDNSTATATTSADFFGGTAGTGTAVVQTLDGEVQLAASLGAEFFGTSLPTGWTSTTLAAGGAAAVGGGSVKANGVVLLGGVTQVGAGRSLDFVATFTGVNQAVGLGAGTLNSPLAVFITKADGNLYSRTVAPNNKGVVTTTDTLMAGVDWLNKAHQYTIDWNGTKAAFKVDGTLIFSSGGTVWGTMAMGPMIYDASVDAAAVSVDWMRLTPYALSGTYTLRFDSGDAGTAWQKLTSTLSAPAGTAATITYRIGSTAAADGSWTPAATAATSNVTLAGTGRYLEITVQMSSTDGTKTPVLKDVAVTFKRP